MEFFLSKIPCEGKWNGGIWNGFLMKNLDDLALIEEISTSFVKCLDFW
jgi:hypothetical protein